MKRMCTGRLAMTLFVSVLVSSCVGERETSVTRLIEKPHLKIVGRWSSSVVDRSFGSYLLIASFEEEASYSFMWIGPLSERSRDNMSQPVASRMDRGTYYVKGDRLYLQCAGVSKECNTVVTNGLLVLMFDNGNIYSLMKCQSQ